MHPSESPVNVNSQGLVATAAESPSAPFAKLSLAWFMFVMAVSFGVFQFALQLTSAQIVTSLMRSFGLSAFGAAVLSSSYYYIYTLMQTPAGMIMDSVGPRKALSIGAVLCAFGCALFAMAPNAGLALLGRILMGAGTSCAFVGVLYISMHWFPVRMFGFLVGVVETIGMISGLLGGIIIAHAVEQVGWRYAMGVAAGLALFFGVLIAIFLKDKPKAQVMATESVQQHHFWQEFITLIKKPVAWINGFYIGLIFSFVTVFAALWGVPFLRLAHHWSLMKATVVADLIFLGVAIGGPIMGWFDNHIQHRYRLLSIAGVLVMMFVVAIIYLPQLSDWLVMLLMFLIGLVASVYVIGYTVASEMATPIVRSTSVGFANALAVSSAPLLQPFIGYLLHLTGKITAGQQEVYSLHAYQIAMSVIPLAALIAAILAWFIPSRPQPNENPLADLTTG